MLLNLLDSTGANQNNGGGWIIWVVFGVIIVAMVVMNTFSSKKRKAAMEAEKEKRNSIKPGFKIVTIGGIVGTVVSVDDESNSFVLQTGSEENPSFLTFDKVAIYTSEDPNAVTEEPVEEIAEEHAEDTPFEEKVETSEDVAPVEETVDADEEEKAE